MNLLNPHIHPPFIFQLSHLKNDFNLFIIILSSYELDLFYMAFKKTKYFF